MRNNHKYGDDDHKYGYIKTSSVHFYKLVPAVSYLLTWNRKVVLFFVIWLKSLFKITPITWFIIFFQIFSYHIFKKLNIIYRTYQLFIPIIIRILVCFDLICLVHYELSHQFLINTRTFFFCQIHFFPKDPGFFFLKKII
jgi:hypothetical protein